MKNKYKLFVFVVVAVLIISGLIGWGYSLFDDSFVTKSELAWGLLLVSIIGGYNSISDEKELQEIKDKLEALTISNTYFGNQSLQTISAEISMVKDKISRLCENDRVTKLVQACSNSERDLWEKIRDLEATVESLQQRLNNHTWDCEFMYECSCGIIIKESDMEFLEDGYHLCKKCAEGCSEYSLKRVRHH